MKNKFVVKPGSGLFRKKNPPEAQTAEVFIQKIPDRAAVLKILKSSELHKQQVAILDRTE